MYTADEVTKEILVYDVVTGKIVSRTEVVDFVATTVFATGDNVIACSGSVTNVYKHK